MKLQKNEREADSFTVNADLDEDQYEIEFWLNGDSQGFVGGLTLDDAYEKGQQVVDGLILITSV